MVSTMIEQAREVQLATPLDEKTVRALGLGDRVYLTGQFFTGRSRFHQHAIDEANPPPIDYAQINVLMHVGPVLKRDGNRWVPVSLDQTSSIRFSKWEPETIRRLGLRAIIGKTTMDEATACVMRECGCVHLTRVGTPGNLLARCVTRVVDVFNLEEDGMTEATWVFEAENLGPFIVDIDARGNNLFRDVRRATELKMKLLYQRFGIPADFTYAGEVSD